MGGWITSSRACSVPVFPKPCPTCPGGGGCRARAGGTCARVKWHPLSNGQKVRVEPPPPPPTKQVLCTGGGVSSVGMKMLSAFCLGGGGEAGAGGGRASPDRRGGGQEPPPLKPSVWRSPTPRGREVGKPRCSGSRAVSRPAGAQWESSPGAVGLGRLTSAAKAAPGRGGEVGSCRDGRCGSEIWTAWCPVWSRTEKATSVRSRP